MQAFRVFNEGPWPLRLAGLSLLGLALAFGAVMFLTSCGASPTTCHTCQPPTPEPSPTATATPIPCPSPDTCSPRGEWKIAPRECADLGRIGDTAYVREGQTCLMDTTPQPRCNSEGSEGCPPNACGMRRECEPLRGPDWEMFGAGYVSDRDNCPSGQTCWTVNPANDYQAFIIRPRGAIRVFAHWPPDAEDQDGKLLDLDSARSGYIKVVALPAGVDPPRAAVEQGMRDLEDRLLRLIEERGREAQGWPFAAPGTTVDFYTKGGN